MIGTGSYLPGAAGVEARLTGIEDVLPVGAQRAYAQFLDREPDHGLECDAPGRDVVPSLDLWRLLDGRDVQVGKVRLARLTWMPMERDKLSAALVVKLVDIAF